MSTKRRRPTAAQRKARAQWRVRAVAIVIATVITIIAQVKYH